MTKRKFRLERIYRLRSKLCEMEEMKTRRAHRQRDESREALEGARRDVNRSVLAMVRSGYQGCRADVLHRQWSHRVKLELDRNSREKDLTRKERQVDRCRRRLNRARQRKETLQKLKEREERKLRTERLKREQKMIDEIAVVQHVRKGGEGPL